MSFGSECAATLVKEQVDAPSRLREEAVVIREMPVATGVAGNNQIGDKAM
ncbi:hypothetical protein [Allorhodopirellula heiligendammensis]|nr:hypothetical protein [Allorhodopirellula heiligendammensis]